MSTVIPISLVASPVPTSLSAATLTEFMQLVAQYVSGSVSADVTFFLEGSVDPVVDEGVVFFNTVQNCFKSWSNDTGSYLPIGFLFTDTLPLTKKDKTHWEAILPLPPGRYRYLCRIDGQDVLDPLNPDTETEAGRKVSILTVK